MYPIITMKMLGQKNVAWKKIIGAYLPSTPKVFKIILILGNNICNILFLLILFENYYFFPYSVKELLSSNNKFVIFPFYFLKMIKN